MSNEIVVHIVEDQKMLREVLEYVKTTYTKPTVVALDVETNDKLPQKAKTWGIGFCFEETEAFYIPIFTNTGLPYSDFSRSLIEEVLNELKKHKVIGHNFVYDYIVLLKDWRADFLESLYADTILMKHSIDEERPHGLKETSVKYLGSWADLAQEELYASITKNGGATTKDNLEMWKADTLVLGKYCGWDCALTLRLHNLFLPMLEEQGLIKLFFEDEIMPLYKEVTLPMTLNGFPVNVKHFEGLHTTILGEINTLEASIQSDIEPFVEGFCQDLLNKDYPIKTAGSFPKALAEVMNVSLPLGPTGKVSLSKKALQNTLDMDSPYAQWLFTGDQTKVPKWAILQAQMNWFFKDNPDRNHVFNLKSNDHLGTLLFSILNLPIKSKTESGKPQVSEDVLEEHRNSYVWIAKLLDMKKLLKLESTYISAILERQIEGVLYPSWLQFGTTSGRYSSSNINCQNLPRIKDEESGLSELVLSYANQIKEGFVALPKHKLIGADYSQLEPCAFACASEDHTLQDVFQKGHDLYSSIAIKTFNLPQYSADKKADNYLGKHAKEARQKAKVIALAVVYGAGAGRLASILGVKAKEAQVIIDAYLDAYPQLQAYMDKCDRQAISQGFVMSRYGRIRHIPRAKVLYENFGGIVLNQQKCRNNEYSDVYWELRGLLNLAKNHPIQSTASYIVNKAAIAFSREMRLRGLSGRIVAQVHDELTCMADDKDAEQVSRILQECMENTTKIEVPLRATPVIANNWAEAK